ncbi:MAG: response regulator [Halobacteriovoraceae bacterium]|jgi:two-component system, chemotaxis family, sensor kinase CheA|nr:response regulator [Halobacteriovoraceae bacterium]MBT5095607.1 response regulator [Halobacteriovoraceae bacterium]
MDNKALLDDFLIESFDNLSNIEEELTQFENDSSNTELLNNIYRKVHTLKGSSSFLGFKSLQKITHTSENILDLVREGKVKIDPKMMDVLLEAFDICQSILKVVEEKGDEGDGNYDGIYLSLLGALEKFTSDDFSALKKDEVLQEEKLQPLSVVKNDAEEIPEAKVAASAVVPEEASVVTEEEPQPSTVTQEANDEKLPIDKEVQKDEVTQVKGKTGLSSSNISDSFVRVNVNLLDRIMNVVGELVLTRNQIVQYTGNYSGDPILNKLSHGLNVITSELQNEIMNTRMQPVGSVLSKYERIVRDLARAQKKSISLELSGQDTELDKTLLEAIKDPLTHIIRNCIDHGIETPDERIKNGKPESSVLFIRAYHEGGQVALEIKDDGRGIVRDKIVSKAIEKDLISEEKSKIMSDNEVYNLLFAPGFSTADKVTNISGRGVGMDVVRTNIEKIGGSVMLTSVPGKGTTLKLRIPLTLAIIPALIFKSEEEFFAIPQINLVELVRVSLSGSTHTKLETIKDSDFLRLRGELIPILRLSKVLKLKDVHEKAKLMASSMLEDAGEVVAVEKSPEEEENLDTDATATESTPEENLENEKPNSDEENVIILNAEGHVYGLIIDEILDTEEIVVKPLDHTLKELHTYAGATIMGDGKAALILDALGFLNMINEKHDSQSYDQTKLTQEKPDGLLQGEAQELIVFTLGDDRKYGIPLILVNRLEEFEMSKVEFTGRQPIVQYRNHPMPLLNLEKTLKMDDCPSVLDQLAKLSSSPDEQSTLDQDTPLSCIVVENQGKQFGFVVKEIQDIAISDTDVDSAVVDRDGILGTVFVNDKTVSVVDIFDIIGFQKFGQTGAKKEVQNLKGAGHILVVDDSPLYRKMVSQVLQEYGYSTKTACDGQEALSFLGDRVEYDLIISDIEMPNMNGYDFASSVREHPTYSNSKLIALTTKIAEIDLKKGKAAGFDYQLEKFKKEQVLEAVQSCIYTDKREVV